MNHASALSAFDRLVGRMVQLHIPRDRAERAAREQLGLPDPAAVPIARDAGVPEKVEQWEISKLFSAFRFKVRNLSQARASKQAPGIADLFVVHESQPIAFWWESKRQVGGAHSPAQLDFRDDCARCGVGYGTGDRYAARAHLVSLGFDRAAEVTW